MVETLGWRVLKTPTSETPDFWGHVHASIPLAQTPWGLTGRAWLQARAQRVVIVVLPPLNSLGIDSRNDFVFKTTATSPWGQWVNVKCRCHLNATSYCAFVVLLHIAVSCSLISRFWVPYFVCNFCMYPFLSLEEKSGHKSINSLRPNDAIWQHRSGSTLAQVMACCLTAPSHYLNQCWLTISKV